MQRTAIVIFSLFLSSALFAKKKPHSSGAAPAVSQMTADQKAIHALNRLTFGARPGDLDAVKQIGLEQWIEQQLHPAAIVENPVLEAKLAPFDTLRMTTAQLVRHYPTPQMVKAMVDGRQQFPSDPDSHFLLEKLIAKARRKEGSRRTFNRFRTRGNSTISRSRFSRAASRRSRQH